MSDRSGFRITQDGIMPWFLGPDWVDVTQEALEKEAPNLVSAAQADAPWEDRTGDARDGLHTEVVREGDSVSIYLAHSVEYGQWLETIQNGNFAVIMPTLERLAPGIFRNVAQAVGNARRGY